MAAELPWARLPLQAAAEKRVVLKSSIARHNGMASRLLLQRKLFGLHSQTRSHVTALLATAAAAAAAEQDVKLWRVTCDCMLATERCGLLHTTPLPMLRVCGIPMI